MFVNLFFLVYNHLELVHCVVRSVRKLNFAGWSKLEMRVYVSVCVRERERKKVEDRFKICTLLYFI